jgi:hypothetical protein
VLVADETSLSSLDEASLHRLLIAIDPDGESDLRHDFPDDDWPDVWRRETASLVDMCNAGQIGLCVLHNGAFHFEISLLEGSQMTRHAPTRLCVSSGKLCVVELGGFVEARYSEMSPDMWTYELPAGDYLVDFLPTEQYVVSDDGLCFGSSESPALRLSISTWQPVRPLAELVRFRFCQER